MTAGQMRTHLAAPSDRHAPSVFDARSVARTRRAGPLGTGPPGSVSTTLSLDAKAGDIGSELLVLARLVGDAVPAIRDRLFRGRGIELTGEELGERGVQDILFVALGQRDPCMSSTMLGLWRLFLIASR
jgi:hypothetical protein